MGWSVAIPFYIFKMSMYWQMMFVYFIGATCCNYLSPNERQALLFYFTSVMTSTENYNFLFVIFAEFYNSIRMYSVIKGKKAL